MTAPLVATTTSIASSPSYGKSDPSSLICLDGTCAPVPEPEENTPEGEQQLRTSTDSHGNFFANFFRRRKIEDDGDDNNGPRLADTQQSTGSGESGAASQEDASTCSESPHQQSSLDGSDEDSKESDKESSDSDGSDTTSDREDDSVEVFHENAIYQQRGAPYRQERTNSSVDDFDDVDRSVQESNDVDSEEGDEFYSLIGTPKYECKSSRDKGNSLRLRLSKLFAIKGEEEPREQRGLLVGNYTDDENDEDGYENEDDSQPTRHSLVTDCSNTDRYSDVKVGNANHDDGNDDDDDDDDSSKTGQHRLESFYPGVDLSRGTSSPGSQDLFGRIHGYGYDDQTRKSDSGFGRLLLGESMRDIPMTSIDGEINEKRGFFNGVGNAVSSIADFIRQQREVERSSEKERRRILDYVYELEYSLAQKDEEVKSWKKDAEQLQVEINRLKGIGMDGEEEEEEEEEEESTDSDNSSIATAMPEGAVINRNERYRDDLTPAGEDDTTAREGTLLDFTPKPFAFDPLAAVGGLTL